MLSLVEDLLMYARFAVKLPRYLAEKDTVEGGRALLEEHLANRESNFLWVAENAIYGYPRSPYLPLLREARCELGDLRKMVSEDGLEQTLHALRHSGVCFRFEQFKGSKYNP